jgi:hypothetical protein
MRNSECDCPQTLACTARYEDCRETRAFGAVGLRPDGASLWRDLLALGLAAVAVIAAVPSTYGQVYSANVVGYVSETLTNCYTFLANPLSNDISNDLRTLIPSPPGGTRVWLWNVTKQVFDEPAVFSNSDWSTNLDLPVGRGFVIQSDENWTLTFVGEVLQGWLTNFVAGSNRLSLLGSQVPRAGPLSADMEFPGSDGDDVYLFPPTCSGYLDACTFYTDYGWFDPQGIADPGGPVIEVASAFFVRHPGPDTNWVRYFEVPNDQPNRAKSMPGATVPRILHLTLCEGMATLELSQTGTPYNVQWSSEGCTWTTLAASQTGATWTGPCPPGARGYFQLTQP